MDVRGLHLALQFQIQAEMGAILALVLRDFFIDLFSALGGR